MDYEYEELSGPDREGSAALAGLTAENLGHLPQALIQELQHATASGNKRGLDRLILQVRETSDPSSADGLKALADKYQYDTLTSLLEEARPPGGG